MGLIERTIQRRKSRSSIGDDARIAASDEEELMVAFQTVMEDDHRRILSDDDGKPAAIEPGELPARPSTSWNSQTTLRGDLENVSSAKIEFKAGKETFAFPLPEIKPTKRLPVRSSSYQNPSMSINTVRFSQAIGIAIGSPSQYPPEYRPHTSGNVKTSPPKPPPLPPPPTSLPPAAPETVVVDFALVDQPKKHKAWRMLPAFFGKSSRRAVKEVTQPASQAVPGRVATRQSSPMREERRGRATDAQGENGTPRASVSQSRHRNMNRTMARAQANQRYWERDEKVKPSVPPVKAAKDKETRPGRNETPELQVTLVTTADDGTLKEVNGALKEMNGGVVSPVDSPIDYADPSSTPYLTIDLPGSNLDRYSVMFEKLLQPRQSIIERRRSRHMQLQLDGRSSPGSMIDEAVPPLRRSATSPGRAQFLSIKLQTLDTAPPQRPSTAKASMSPEPQMPKTTPPQPRPRADSVTYRTPPMDTELTTALVQLYPDRDGTLTATARLQTAEKVTDLPLLTPSPVLGSESTPTTPSTCSGNESVFTAHETPLEESPVPAPLRLRSASKPAPPQQPPAAEPAIKTQVITTSAREPVEVESPIVHVLSIAQRVNMSKPEHKTAQPHGKSQPRPAMRPKMVEVNRSSGHRRGTVEMVGSV